jgi:hypothetical protein
MRVRYHYLWKMTFSSQIEFCAKGGVVMFLVRDHERGNLVFTHRDPISDGFTGEVKAGVTLDSPQDMNDFPDGCSSSEDSVGVSPDDPKAFKVFRDDQDRRKAGYARLWGNAANFSSWKDYARQVEELERRGKPRDA